jgi:vacuolar protein sorting-associated protein 41
VVLQVEVYAEYAPDQLLPFLQSSKQFNKEAALQVCKDRGLVREQVFILGRLSRARDALQLMIVELRDLPQAIAFVQNHAELWDELIALVMKDPELIGELLDRVCPATSPFLLLRFCMRQCYVALHLPLLNCQSPRHVKSSSSRSAGCAAVV